MTAELFLIQVQRVDDADGRAGVSFPIFASAGTELVIECASCGHRHGVHSTFLLNGRLHLVILPCPKCMVADTPARDDEPSAYCRITDIISESGQSLTADETEAIIDALVGCCDDDMTDSHYIALMDRIVCEITMDRWTRSKVLELVRRRFFVEPVPADEAVEHIKTIITAVG